MSSNLNSQQIRFHGVRSNVHVHNCSQSYDMKLMIIFDNRFWEDLKIGTAIVSSFDSMHIFQARSGCGQPKLNDGIRASKQTTVGKWSCLTIQKLSAVIHGSVNFCVL